MRGGGKGKENEVCQNNCIKKCSGEVSKNV